MLSICFDRRSHDGRVNVVLVTNHQLFRVLVDAGASIRDGKCHLEVVIRRELVICRIDGTDCRGDEVDIYRLPLRAFTAGGVVIPNIKLITVSDADEPV